MWNEEKTCSYCGKEVFIYHRKRAKQEHVFCSPECNHKFYTLEPNVRCFICGKPMHVKPSRLRRLIHGNITCSIECDNKHREVMYLGVSNPNAYITYDFSDIYNLTHDGAYLLGLIYSDGSISKNTICISQNKFFSGNLLKKIADRISGGSGLYSKDNIIDNLRLNSKELVEFILNLGGIKTGKKDTVVNLPNIPEDKKWSFICGYFDGDGGFNYNYKYPNISITSNSSDMLCSLSKYWGVNYTGGDKIYANGFKALDICGKMYENVSFKHFKKYYYYMDILNWQKGPYGPAFIEDTFKYRKYDSKALPPQKSRVTDSGYDIFAVDFIYDEINDLYIADTKLAISPVAGWYFDMVGRSSLPKTGFMFVGGVGVIDRSYVGSVKMLLKKIKDNAELPELPFKLAQIIPRPIIHANFIEVEEFEETDRGEGGFGSTGTKSLN